MLRSVSSVLFVLLLRAAAETNDKGLLLCSVGQDSVVTSAT